jgi:hypothetical protein
MIRTNSRTVFARTIARTILIFPFIAMPFTLWGGEMWVQMQIYSNDYERAATLSEIDAERTRIEHLEERAARLKTLRQMEASAPDLGLVEPAPGQINVIRIVESELLPKEFEPYDANTHFADARTEEP